MAGQNISDQIAIIGMSGRFPGANNPQQFWHNLLSEEEQLTRFNQQQLRDSGVPEESLRNLNYVPVRGVVTDVASFDAGFFGMSDLEADVLDPQHRLFMMCAWEALEDANMVLDKNLNRVGVFASTGLSHYLLNNILTNPELLESVDQYSLLLSQDKDFIATRTSYHLNLHGPSMTIQTGCSSSMTCIHVAIQSILNGECVSALAGGVSLSLPQEQGYIFQKGMISSKDGHCKPFDDQADGTVKSNGVGVILLKSMEKALADGDLIYAVICSSAVNNDGQQKVSFTAPRVARQANVISEAIHLAGIKSDDIDYVETHGTGTALGDPIEIEALKKAFALSSAESSAFSPCMLGSVKSNIGHLDVAAGVTGVIKTAFALQQAIIPATLNFTKLNSKIDLRNSPFSIQTETTPWPRSGAHRYAGVSSFGVGGTNVHMVMKNAPIQAPQRTVTACEQHLIMLSAATPRALAQNCAQLVSFVQSNGDVSLSDVAYTLHSGRQTMKYRVAFSVSDNEQLQDKIAMTDFDGLAAHDDSQTDIVFMISGQGNQYVGMAQELYRGNHRFKQYLDSCFAHFSELDMPDMANLLFGQAAQESVIEQTELAQPLLFAVEYALAQTLLDYGIVPKALIGHSLGEYVAATLAGVFSLKDVLALICERGRLIQSLPRGAMLAVNMGSEHLQAILPVGVDIALQNAANMTVASGTFEGIDALIGLLESKGVRCTRLNTSHAFHSHMLDAAVGKLEALVGQYTLSEPKLPIVSNVTGTWLTAAQATDPSYWARHMRSTVKFYSGINTLLTTLKPKFLEVGVGRSLQSMLVQQGITGSVGTIPPKQEQAYGAKIFLQALGNAWLYGAKLNTKLYSDSGVRAHRIRLPVYSWDLKSHWISAGRKAVVVSKEVEHEPNLSHEELLRGLWLRVLGRQPESFNDNFFSIGGNSISAVKLIEHLPEPFTQHVEVVHMYEYPNFGQFVRFLGELAAKQLQSIPTPNSESMLNEDEDLVFMNEGEI